MVATGIHGTDWFWKAFVYIKKKGLKIEILKPLLIHFSASL